MDKKNKYCPNCGKELTQESKFCSDCGYDFEKKVKDEKKSGPSNESKVKLQKEINQLNTKKIIGVLAVLGVLMIAYTYFGGLDIAGTYESDYTIADPYRTSALEISKNGKATLREIDNEEAYNLAVTFKLLESNDGTRYYADLGENIDLEFTIPMEAIYDDYYMFDMEMLTTLAGLEQDQDGNMMTLSGELTPFLANQMEIDLSELQITKDNNLDALMIFDAVYYNMNK